MTPRRPSAEHVARICAPSGVPVVTREPPPLCPVRELDRRFLSARTGSLCFNLRWLLSAMPLVSVARCSRHFRFVAAGHRLPAALEFSSEFAMQRIAAESSCPVPSERIGRRCGSLAPPARAAAR